MQPKRLLMSFVSNALTNPSAIDRGESVSMMMPLRLSEDSRFRGKLNDLALELARKSEGLKKSLPASIQSALADLIRSMNCYYSNLIEGHATHPIDIERALRHDYSNDLRKRNLQREACAHIEVQKWIDEGHLTTPVFSTQTICTIHFKFCENLPEDLLIVEDDKLKIRHRIIAGQFRAQDVQVGNHIPISSGAIPRFMSAFTNDYQALGKHEQLLAIAAAHHRLLWIHPFLDGNGRVTRLMSHAALLEILDTAGLWSISRGLARQVNLYKTHLANCDLHRRNDLDGRGNLSEEMLAQFTEFFLTTCLDQVSFMESLIEPNMLRMRILRWTEEQIILGKLPEKTTLILDSLLYRGSLRRDELAKLLDVSQRQARRYSKTMIEQGILASEGPREPLKLAFPAKFAGQWMPGLFPEKT